MLKRTILLAFVPFALFASPAMSVVTVNMARESSVDRVAKEFQAIPAIRDADVLLLQEVQHQPGQPQCVAAELASRIGFHIAYSPAASGATDEGLAILSRYPLKDVKVRALPNYDLRFHTRSRFVIAATVEAPSGPVRIFDTHLDTRVNAAERLAQLTPVIRDAAEFRGPKIIAGDFNSNDFYWIGHVLPLPGAHSQARDIHSFMTGAGFQTGLRTSQTTFDYLGMHLDWIWSRGVKIAGTHVYPLQFSDHHAVWTRLEL